MESPRMSKHIFLPSLKEDPGTDTPDVTRNVVVIHSFSVTWETQLKLYGVKHRPHCLL